VADRVILPTPNPPAAWREVDLAEFDARLRDGLAALALNILTDPDPEVRTACALNWPQIEAHIVERWQQSRHQAEVDIARQRGELQ
jgi:hypothetical protein